MEEEEESSGGGRHRVTSDQAKALCRKTLELHARLRGDEDDEEVDEDDEGGSDVETSDGRLEFAL